MSIESLFLKSQRDGPVLRVGLLLPPGACPAPTRGVLEHLRACNFVELVAAISTPHRQRAEPRHRKWCYQLYRWFDRTIHRRAARALAPDLCAAQLGGVARYALEWDSSGSGLKLPLFQRAILASCKFDVLLAFGQLPGSTELISLTRYGIWQCQLGDPLLGDDQLRVFWNTIQQTTPLTVSLIALIPGEAEPQALTQGTMPLNTRVSTIRNLEGPARMGESLILTKLWQLHSAGWEFVLAQRPPANLASSQQRLAPTNLQMLLWALSKSVYQIVHRWRQLNTKSVWQIGFRRQTRAEGLAAACSIGELTWVDSPTNHYFADPFLVSHAGKTCLFFEDFDLDTEVGKIAWTTIEPDGSYKPPETALERPYHLSYPQVFEHEGDVYMIPETGFNKTVELYRAIEFPTRWELHKVLFHGQAFDTTLLQHDGRFWFFLTMMDLRAPQCTQLLLFHSDALDGSWTLHPASPISNDSRHARCAGAPFRDGAHWIRPAQDCSETYGGALRYQRIVNLNVNSYAEESAGVLSSDSIQGAFGVHTYNRNAGLEVIDCKTRIKLAVKSQAGVT